MKMQVQRRAEKPADRRRAKGRRQTSPLGDILNNGPGVQAQLRLRESLDRSPRVVAQMRRAEALSASSGPVVQRNGYDVMRSGGGALVGGLLGSYLDAYLPLHLGSIGLGLLGGAAGYYAPSLLRTRLPSSVIRKFLARPLWQEVNRKKDEDPTSWLTPEVLADQLAESSGEFRELRELAERQVRATHGQGLEYSPGEGRMGPYGGTYGQGRVRVDERQHPAMMLMHLVFETANASQAVFIERVRQDYEGDGMQELETYGELLGRDPEELGKLADQYDEGSPQFQRSLVQEWAEWQSLLRARTVFQSIKDRFTSSTGKDGYDLTFGVLDDIGNFADYYENRGSDHRRGVEETLNRLANQD